MGDPCGGGLQACREVSMFVFWFARLRYFGVDGNGELPRSRDLERVGSSYNEPVLHRCENELTTGAERDKAKQRRDIAGFIGSLP